MIRLERARALDMELDLLQRMNKDLPVRRSFGRNW